MGMPRPNFKSSEFSGNIDGLLWIPPLISRNISKLLEGIEKNYFRRKKGLQHRETKSKNEMKKQNKKKNEMIKKQVKRTVRVFIYINVLERVFIYIYVLERGDEYI